MVDVTRAARNHPRRRRLTVAALIIAMTAATPVGVPTIVSGFLVGGSVWRLIAQARFDLGAYLINRFARIYLTGFRSSQRGDAPEHAVTPREHGFGC